jgi:hypothetical protein
MNDQSQITAHVQDVPRLCENCSLATTEAIISDVAQSRIPLSLQKWYSFA